jgi:hypothetical protein
LKGGLIAIQPLRNLIVIHNLCCAEKESFADLSVLGGFARNLLVAEISFSRQDAKTPSKRKESQKPSAFHLLA